MNQPGTGQELARNWSGTSQELVRNWSGTGRNRRRAIWDVAPQMGALAQGGAGGAGGGHPARPRRSHMCIRSALPSIDRP